MASTKKAILFGFVTWLIPFIAGFLLFPIHDSHRILFESIMPVVVAASAVFFGYRYFKMTEQPKQEAVKLGVLWFVISIAIDLILFLSPSPMHMGLVAYIQDIGITYLIIPCITVGLGYAFGVTAVALDKKQ